ncbi:putative uncharacterized protein DDB_G0271606 isoform X1 [Drosophila nasuta]|uniref:putative uncharacterized protein DDB_G0271606 isoform X1 n=1 Tax=Drosophila nasuta TaxID=42062 RepID=UPI00295E3F4B|nr:putative uncharacterized protein DDB_G0271606 isoform X1 [Drosophila nasuta]
MKTLLLLSFLLGLATCEPPVVKGPLVFSSSNWPPKRVQQLGRPAPIAAANSKGGKQRTLVVQIRSDHPVPLVLKGRAGVHSHAHQHVLPHQHVHLPSHSHSHAYLQQSHLHSHSHSPSLPLSHVNLVRGSRPLKLSAPVYLKPSSVGSRKPLKIKLNNSKPHSKPVFGYEKPFRYEKPTANSHTELQHLPLDSHTNNYNNEFFAPIYTVPAPNLALHHNNQLDDGLDTAYLPPQPSQNPPAEVYGPPDNGHEDETNDQTIRDPISGSQKLFAPDPDPSLPTSKVKIATEAFNTPSNNKPLPTDVQISQLPAQPLVQIVGAQAAAQTVPIYPIQLAQQATQPFIAAAVPAAHIPIYNPTYLVTQSNQLYTQHKQQLFKPSTEHVVETGYINADLTQEVASNGQILQAAKDPHHNIHPVLDTAPQYAALIAAPSLGEPSESYYETAPFHLPNNAPAVASSSASEGGFIVSNYYGNAHDSSQLLQAYAEEEGRRQQLETQQAAIELQKQQEQQYHLEELNAQAQAQAQAQTQAQLQQQEQQLQELQRQQYLQEQQQQQQLEFQQTQQDPASSAFEEHQRLVQQQLGSNTPLRIFVPDEETPETRLQKRSDDLNKGTVKDVSHEDDGLRDLIPVSTSVEIAEANSK